MMNTYLHSAIAMLAVINPVVCGVMMIQIGKDQSKKSNIVASVKSMITVLIILLLAALSGKSILHAFGISLDAFKVVGGIILSFIGFQMMIGSKNNNGKSDKQNGLAPLIMFAASPGTITMVITLSVVHNKVGLPISAMLGTTIAVLLTTVIMIAMQLLSKEGKPHGQGIFSKFMGLIIVAMGVQFILEGIKVFFGL